MVSKSRLLQDEQGIALVLALIALSMFSAVAFYLSFNSVAEVRISDNYESHVQARYAALAGMSHARELLRGLQWNDLLKGPDGTYDNGTTYMAEARTFAFRKPLSWATARSLNIFSPSVTGVPDDGIFNTGMIGGTAGTVLIPLTGIAQTATNPYGSGTITTSRYFVKVSDNNGEASELAKDAADNPFIDGDSTIIVRSMGISRTISENAGGVMRANSVVVFEARFQQGGPFNMNSPVIVEGNVVTPYFDGNSFDVVGGPDGPGIGTIDTNTGDTVYPAPTIAAATGGKGDITGGGYANPSVRDITSTVTGDPLKEKLMDPAWLYDFAFNQAPKWADNVVQGNTSWSGSSTGGYDIGYYDIFLPPNDPSQRPKVTWVNGELSLAGNMRGGGLLVVTGNLYTNGSLRWDGLILVIGQGFIDCGGLNLGIFGGLFVANVTMSGGTASFGVPAFDMHGNSNITFNSGALAMANGLISANQIGLREITSNIDP